MLQQFNKYIEDGLIRRQVSPCGRLALFDYTEKCQFEKAWDEVTLNARGSVYEISTGKLVAKSFPKFFNFSELSPERQEWLAAAQNFSVYEKMDGSLGIIYYYDGEWRVNTRGSFTSDQAIEGLKLLKELRWDKLNTNHTYLAEIIYPSNRIVVDYKGESFLSLLHIYETESGEDVDYEVYPFLQSAYSYKFETIAGVQAKLKTLSYNEEGYVVQFRDGSRAKFKGDEYVEMHRVVTGLSPLVLWENMVNGRVSEQFIQNIPEEFRAAYEDMAKELNTRAEDTMYRITYHVNGISRDLFSGVFQVTPENRKKLGLHLKENNSPLNSYVFPYMLGNITGVWEMVQKEIRPTANKL